MYIFRTCKTVCTFACTSVCMGLRFKEPLLIITDHCDLSVFTSIHTLSYYKHCNPKEDRPVFKNRYIPPFFFCKFQYRWKPQHFVHVLKRQLQSGHVATATCALLSPRSCGETNTRSQSKCFFKNQKEDRVQRYFCFRAG